MALLVDTVGVMATSLTQRRVVGHVDLDCFFAAAELLRRPELRGMAVAVGGTGRGGVVSTATYEARKFGVGSGMPMRRARSLCPGLVVVGVDMDWYKTLSMEVLVAVAAVADVVEPVSLDEAYLGFDAEVLGGVGVVALGEEIRSRVRARTGLTISFGAGMSRVVAKLASERAKPDGLVVVEPGTEWAFLASHALASLVGIGSAGLAKLERAGIGSVASLAGMDPDLLATSQETGRSGTGTTSRSQTISSMTTSRGSREKDDDKES